MNPPTRSDGARHRRQFDRTGVDRKRHARGSKCVCRDHPMARPKPHDGGFLANARRDRDESRGFFSGLHRSTLYRDTDVLVVRRNHPVDCFGRSTHSSERGISPSSVVAGLRIRSTTGSRPWAFAETPRSSPRVISSRCTLQPKPTLSRLSRAGSQACWFTV